MKTSAFLVSHRQIAIYISIGIGSAILDVGIMQLLILSGLHFMLAVTAGFIVGLLLNFFLHANFTFRSRHTVRAFSRYMSAVVFNYLLTLLCVFGFEQIFQLALVGKLVSLPVVATTGYILGKHWIFKQ